MTDKASNDGDITLYAAGDVDLPHTGYKAQFDRIVPTLREADIRYCVLEQVLSNRGTPNKINAARFRVPPEGVEALTYTGIDVVSAGGNHALDFGPEAFVDTIEALQKNGIKTPGIGRDDHEAREPAIVERKGTKIAFLSYNSILPYGAAADMWVAKEKFPGVAPMRAHTFYEQGEFDQPGVPARIHTFPHREDLKALKKDVEKAKSAADIVVVAFHFGVHRIRAQIADYQPDVCYAAIDAGADVIIGTHTHVQKAIEVYKGKVIFYSLANFVFDPAPAPDPSPALVEKFKERKAYWTPYEDHTRKSTDELETSIAKIVVSDKKIKRVSFIPLLVNEKAEPYRPEAGSPGFERSMKYTVDVTREAGYDTKFRVEGGEVVVVT